ncbi:MAG: ABC transporter permease [Candidatus Bipolaricaulia bacterium]
MLKLLIADLKMMYRDRQTLFWALVFPIMFILIFGLFNFDDGGGADVAIIDQVNSPVSQIMVEQLREIDFFEIDETITDEATGRQALKDGELSFVIVIPESFGSGSPQVGAGASLPSTTTAALQVYFDQKNVQMNPIVLGFLRQFTSEANLQAAGAPQLFTLEEHPLDAKQLTYMDFLTPGVIGMALMTSSVIGIAVSISRYREQRILKRILATPLSVRRFLTAEVTSYLILALVQTSLIIGIAKLVYDVNIYGNLIYIYILALLGNLIFLNLGFIVAGLSQTSRSAEGMANVITMPMMFLAGVFFPVDALPGIMQRIVEVLPLTWLLKALRAVALDGETLLALGTELAFVGGWIVLTFIVALRTFNFARE